MPTIQRCGVSIIKKKQHAWNEVICVSPHQCHQSKFIPKTNCSLTFPEMKAPLASTREIISVGPLTSRRLHAQSFCYVQLFVTPCTVACQAPLSIEFSRQEPWSGLLFPSQGVMLTQGSNPHLLHQQVDSLPPHHLGSPFYSWKNAKEEKLGQMLYYVISHESKQTS